MKAHDGYTGPTLVTSWTECGSWVCSSSRQVLEDRDAIGAHCFAQGELHTAFYRSPDRKSGSGTTCGFVSLDTEAEAVRLVAQGGPRVR
jgi:hypothetical protein